MRLVKFLTLFLLQYFLLSQNIFAAQIQLIYEDYFGEYSSGSSFVIDVDLEKNGIQDIYTTLTKELKEIKKGNNSDLLLIAYGNEDLISAYFGGTHNLNNNEILSSVFKKIKPEQAFNQEGAMFYFRFVSKDYSNYAKPGAKEHHWASPWKHLPLIAKQVTFF